MPGPASNSPGQVQVYALSPDGVERLPLTAPNLDAASQQLPEGVYTTFRVYPGRRVLGLSAHLARLAESLALVGQSSPVELSTLRAGLRAVLALAGLPEARLRLTLPFGGPAALASLEPFVPYPAEFYRRGVRAGTIALARETPRAKHTRAIGQAAAARAAAAQQPPQAGVHELLRVDGAGHLLEGLSSNFFAVKAGQLCTGGEGVLLGTTRQVVLDLARGHLPVVERPVQVEKLAQVSEAFITSASREIMPVVQVDAALIGAGQPGPTTLDLLARYQAYVRAHAEEI